MLKKIIFTVLLITIALPNISIAKSKYFFSFGFSELNMNGTGSYNRLTNIPTSGFLNTDRAFPDGRDLNRSFPGTKRGSLASRVAYYFTTQVLPHADYCLDFHTGGASRFNAAQVRVNTGDQDLLNLAKVFNVPFTVFSKNLKKTYRSTCDK